ncbi:hypothetical protein, partial [Xanthomonas translucens]|uniref:hypothetical protein n=1 Tax=Xanthomonas campestris pv. translucens TaxID=343 RepID=UPI001E38A742
ARACHTAQPSALDIPEPGGDNKTNVTVKRIMAKLNHGKSQRDPIVLWKRIEPLIRPVKPSPLVITAWVTRRRPDIVHSARGCNAISASAAALSCKVGSAQTPPSL